MTNTENINLLISVIVPIFNVEQYLPKCLNSIINQTYKNIEIILINDGSTDSSGKICDEYEKKDKRIKVIHKENGGVSEARNVGIKISKGRYITFIDADDWIEKDYFGIVNNFLLEYTPDMLINNYIKVDNNGDIIINFKSNKNVVELNKRDALLEMLKGKLFGWYPFATFYKKEICQKMEFQINISFGEDLLFKYEFIKKYANNIVYMPLFKYYYMQRESSSCNSYTISRKIDDLKVLKLIINNENDEINKILINQEYIPRLIGYTKMIAINAQKNELLLKKRLQKEIKNLLYSKLLTQDISFINKLKMSVCLMPNSIIKSLYVIYKSLK